MKIWACELLHSITIYMVGLNAHRIRDNSTMKENTNIFNKFYLKIFPVILRLSVDIDKISRDLFSSLTFQLIHWFTNNSLNDDSESLILLDCCFSAAICQDGPLRDYGTQCINEFLKWTMKQNFEEVNINNNILINLQLLKINIYINLLII